MSGAGLYLHLAPAARVMGHRSGNQTTELWKPLSIQATGRPDWSERELRPLRTTQGANYRPYRKGTHLCPHRRRSPLCTYVSLNVLRNLLIDREREILVLLAEGLSLKEIATRLDLSVKTVDAHKYNLMRKLDLHDRSELIRYAIRKKKLVEA